MFTEMKNLLRANIMRGYQTFLDFSSSNEMLSSKIDLAINNQNIFEHINEINAFESGKDCTSNNDELDNIFENFETKKNTYDNFIINIKKDQEKVMTQSYISCANSKKSMNSSNLSENIAKSMKNNSFEDMANNVFGLENKLDKFDIRYFSEISQNKIAQPEIKEEHKEIKTDLLNNSLINKQIKMNDEILISLKNVEEAKISNEMKIETKKNKKSKKKISFQKRGYGKTLLQVIHSLYLLREEKKKTYKNRKGKSKKINTSRAAKELHLQKKTMDYYQLQLNKSIVLGSSLICLDFYLNKSFVVVSKKVNEILKTKSKEELKQLRKIYKNKEMKILFNQTLDKFYHMN